MKAGNGEHANAAGISTPAFYPTDKTIVDLLADQVEQTPDNVAVSHGSQTITYRELDRQSNQLAAYLQKQGVAQETLVPICLNRSIEMIVGMLGILKAGGAYVPIDPDYPHDRIAYMLTDTGATVIVTDAASLGVLRATDTEAQLICLDQDWETIAQEPSVAVSTVLSPANLAYVIYTSGSTGRPKGVLVEHLNVVRLFVTDPPMFRFTASDVWTLFHSFCFDFSVYEMYGSLLFGGRLVIVSKEVTRDASRFAELLLAEGVTILNQTPSAFYVLQEVMLGKVRDLPIRTVLLGGESLNATRLKRWKTTYPDCTVMNMYGPTETTVFATHQEITLDSCESNSSIIGRPIPTAVAYVLDASQQPVPVGTDGELYVGGAGVARGYLNQLDLTAERFLTNPFSADVPVRIYRTGDLARLLPNGTLEYLGRGDGQVKIRGFRIELGEIETVLQAYPDVVNCVVLAKEDATGDKRLVGYVVTSRPLNRADVIAHLQTKLPDYMVPRLLVELDSIPLTSNGKVDWRALPDPDASELLVNAYVAPSNPTEVTLASLWKALLKVSKVGVSDNFFELGGNSLLALKLVASLSEQHGYELPVTKLYQFPTVRGMAAFLDGKQRNILPKRRSTVAPAANADVAVIGMAGRFPGASTIDELWTLLKEGRETISFFTDDELDASLSPELVNDPAYVKARGVIRDANRFDAEFFGLNPRLAEAMDPQQRIFLEVAWEVLEQTGYLPDTYDGLVGVYAGGGNNTYYLNNVLRSAGLLRQVGPFQAMTVNEKDFIASRTAYQLNLKGPAVGVYSACSTSLLAIAQAVESIRRGQCDVAIAGGASITAPINSGHIYEEGAMLSRDGHCRSFDADAHGTVFSDGAGVVLLKSLEAARRDGDTIYSVIKGVGVNNDGGGKGSFMAPSAEGQAGAIRAALDDARVDPATISYVEAHGTATPLGDPIEIDGLTMAFGEQEHKQYCAIGSIKSNMGHLTAAAGVAGFIKTTLALYHRQLPPSIGFSAPNPVIDFANSPFVVNTKLTDWAATGQRRAGVSSFGVGGTNVHVVLEEAEQPAYVAKPGRPVQLITWSAKSVESRQTYAQTLATYLQQNPQSNVADLAFTLQTTRPDWAHRQFVVAETTDELASLLAQATTYAATPQRPTDVPTDVVFLFPGQGSQYLNMGRELYENEPVYRDAVDACATLLLPYLDTDIREVMYPESISSIAEERLKNTRFTQPALFVTEYALARLWMSWGIEPAILCGHSIGEFVAAHLADVLTLADALRLVAVRGRLISDLPRGSMLSVRMAAETVQTFLPAGLSMAAVNTDKLCVVAGPDEEIADFARLLDERDIPNRVLMTSHAFHSVMMEPMLAEFRREVEQVALQRPRRPIVSTVTGSWLTDAQATDPAYWTSHARQTVQFAAALSVLLEQPNLVVLEVGPGNVAATLARQQNGSRPATILATLDTRQSSLTDYRAMLKTLGQLWMQGIRPNWHDFYSNQERNKVSLPTYAFDRKLCWVEADVTKIHPESITTTLSLPIVALPAIPPSQTPMRKDTLLEKLRNILENASGIDMDGTTPDMSLLEIGLDSLLLTQVALTLKKEFGLPITFRQLNETYTSLDKLVAYYDANLPADQYQPEPVAQLMPQQVQSATYMPPVSSGVSGDSALGLIAQQLQILSKQVALMQGGTPVQATATPPVATPAVQKPAMPVVPKLTELSAEEQAEIKKPFGATARIDRHKTELSEAQRSFLHNLTERYTRKTQGSKAYSQQHRSYMADPRVVSGFKPLTKEIVYPIVVNKSKGSRLWDLDGNEYIDMLNGFGSNMFGYQPDYIKEALHEQIENGFEVGPQHEMAGEVCQMICDFTGFDRSALCSTGSEAVLGTMRIARTITGRSLIVAFSGSYHGIMDEVIVRGTKKLKTFPAASGIMPEAVQNLLILDYGTEESLRIIEERAHELAAVLVEPVQSRRPEFRPVDFLKRVREITKASGTALIFDEVITGFRMHPGGAQALFGIQADLASYGKVVGAGLPIGVIAGKKEFMDALDGGFWQYGDDSFPEVGVTYFAGTFVRHPLALASAKASLLHLKQQGPDLQKQLTRKAERIADCLNAEFERLQLPIFVAQFGSLWKIKFHEELPYSELLFTLMRDKGIHIWDGFPCFITEAHTDAEIEKTINAFIESVHEMLDAGFFKAPVASTPLTEVQGVDTKKPPVPGAKLGRDQSGNPAWFVPNPDQPGKYLQVVAS